METNNEKYCFKCGAKMSSEAEFCPQCGAKQNAKETTFSNYQPNKINKEWLISLILCVLVGELGVHRFYNGKIGTGILQLITIGGLGIWTLIDIIMIVLERFTDRNGQPMTIYQGRSAF